MKKMAKTKLIYIVAILFSFLGLEKAYADGFVKLPTTAGKRSKHLKIKFVRYDGGTNGQMVVDVKNSSRKGQTFSADGVYFVPQGKPEQAPQRLGASGPFMEVANNKIGKAKSSLRLKPGETKRIRLEVFCIDSHRSSPNKKTKFSIAKKLLPKKLRRDLKTSNKRIYRKYKQNIKHAKSAIQSNMWKTRDAKWIKLEGERVHEKKPKVHRNQIRRNQVHRNQIRQKQIRRIK